MKKRISICFILLCGLFNRYSAQVGVNILTPHYSAAMQIESPAGFTKGMLTPSMTTANRNTIISGTNTAADGLVVYDVNHRMHYYYNAGQSKWVSMSPLILSTPASSSPTNPAGSITTPSSSAIFSVGINKQNPSAALDVVGNTTVSGNITSGGAINASGAVSVGGSLSVTGFPNNALVPAGTIVMWSGNTIPGGWAECNGTSGTPDLRGRFIVAAGTSQGTPVTGDSNPTYSNGSTGGENFHTLTKAEIPKHQHTGNGDGSTLSVGGGYHDHSVPRIGGGVTVVGGGSNEVVPTNGGADNSGGSNHTHNTGDFSGQTGDGTTSGLNNQSHENRPQFYVLKFIMKL
jgi:microcystin-dependent protein